jgi:hypothetical protein
VRFEIFVAVKIALNTKVHLSRFLVTMAQHILRFQMEEMASTYGG